MSNVETRLLKKMKVKVFPNLEQTCSALAEMVFTFDAVILGLGEDGHTASLFPGNPALFESDKWRVKGRKRLKSFMRI